MLPLLGSRRSHCLAATMPPTLAGHNFYCMIEGCFEANPGASQRFKSAAELKEHYNSFHSPTTLLPTGAFSTQGLDRCPHAGCGKLFVRGVGRGRRGVDSHQEKCKFKPEPLPPITMPQAVVSDRGSHPYTANAEFYRELLLTDTTLHEVQGGAWGLLRKTGTTARRRQVASGA